MTSNHTPVSTIKLSSTLAINAKINDLMTAGHQIFHMGFGESRFPVHPKILAAIREHATERSYLPVIGLPALRANIADYYRHKFQIDTNAERVIVGSGSKSLLFAALQSLPGDVLLPNPSWVSYDKQAYLVGKSVRWIQTTLAEDYCLTPQSLEAGIKAAKKAGQSPGILALCTPNNPTGVMYPAELLDELAQIAKANDLIIISDEIYALTAHGNVPHTSIAHYYPEGTVITGGLSKHLSLGGWRLGVAILPPDKFGGQLLQNMTAIASNIWTTAVAPVQHAAIVAYSDDPEIDAYVETCATIHGYVTSYLHQIMKLLNVPCVQPSGGFYLYPNFTPWREALVQKHNIHGSSDLAHFLLDEEHIATLPGSDFGADPHELTLRLSTSYLYALNDQDAESVLDLYRQNLPRDQFLQQACPKVIEVGERFKALVNSLS